MLDKRLNEVPIPTLQQSLVIMSDPITVSKRELFLFEVINIFFFFQISNSILTFYFEVERFGVGEVWDVVGISNGPTPSLQDQ
jgi:hypothetical protein